jgi:hypothetical protein
MLERHLVRFSTAGILSTEMLLKKEQEVPLEPALRKYVD